MSHIHAQLRLTAIQAPDYTQISDDLHWQLILTENKQKTYQSTDSQPVFSVPAGAYQLIATHNSDTVEVTNIELKSHTLHDQVVIFGAIQQGDEDDSYHLSDTEDFNPDTEYQRRQAEREGQRHYGQATDGLNPPPDRFGAGADMDAGLHAKSNLQSHPVLATKVYFDGMPPEITPVTQESDGAQLTLQQQAQKQLQHGSTPTPKLL